MNEYITRETKGQAKSRHVKQATATTEKPTENVRKRLQSENVEYDCLAKTIGIKEASRSYWETRSNRSKSNTDAPAQSN